MEPDPWKIGKEGLINGAGNCGMLEILLLAEPCSVHFHPTPFTRPSFFDVGGGGGSQVNVTMTLFWQELKIYIS